MDLGPHSPNSYVVGDCRELLRSLPDQSVHCVVTSPPYWGLRDYGLPPLVWGGEPECEHAWGAQIKVHKGVPHGDGSMLGGSLAVVDAQAACKDINAGKFCERCNAWRGQLGLEPDYRLYVEHMVEVFREVWRVLRDDGTLWLNLGDCYATGAYSVGSSPGGGIQGDKWRGYRGERLENGRGDQGAELRKKTRATRDGTHAGKHTAIAAMGPMTQPDRMPQPGMKPKDLVGIPWRVAFALQDDGWYLRMDNIWAKPNPMPESVRDRTTRAHEYVFQMAKSQDYYYDWDATRELASTNTHSRGNGLGRKSKNERSGDHRKDGFNDRWKVKNNSSFALATADVVEFRSKRSVWTIPTEPTPDAHFATFPRKLVEPCILAGCPAGGVVLDPFGGSGTTGRVAEDLGRHWLLFDLSPDYAEIAKRKTAQTSLLSRCVP
jgi:DNA modification methylase